MPVEIRKPETEEELRAGMAAAGVAFAEAPNDVDLAREVVSLPAERALVAFDGGKAVALAGAYEFELTIPGGTLPCGGVTWVGVLPTHRRRGILREFMTKQLHDLHDKGEPLAALYASESSIYGRFGYGSATPQVIMEADRGRFAYRDDPGPRGSVELVDLERAYELMPPVFERLRATRAGFFGRSEHWWREHRLADHDHWRQGASPKYYAVLELDGEVQGYALYRVKDEWDRGLPKNEVRVIEAVGATVEAEREIWRFLFSIDLTTKVRAWKVDPSLSLFLMVRDPRALGLLVGDGVWLRVVDVAAALEARSYVAGEPVVLEIRDELCPWNAGRFRVGGDTGRTDAAAELALDVAALGGAYLGAFTFEQLASAGRVEELADGALARATSLFRTSLPPFCLEDF